MRAEGGLSDGGHEKAVGRWSRTQLTYPSNLLVPIETWLPRDVCLRSISAGGNHSVFLTDEGDVWACGCNYNGTNTILPFTHALARTVTPCGRSGFCISQSVSVLTSGLNLHFKFELMS